MNEARKAEDDSTNISEAPIDAEEFSARLIELCLNSRLSRLPRKLRDQHIFFKSMTLIFDKDEEYAERDINYRLQVWLADIGRSLKTDHVHLRRWLVDAKYLERDSHGSRYRVANTGPAREMFAPDVENIDIYETIGIGIKAAQQKKQDYLQRQAED